MNLRQYASVRILRRNISFPVATLLALGTMTGCSGGSSGGQGPTSYSPPSSAPSLQSVSVTPGTASVLAGKTQQFTATGTYSDGSTQDLSSTASWSSSDTTVATVNSAGLATTLSEGSSDITAALQSVTGSSQLTATPLTVQVSVVANDPSGHTLSYQWRSTDGSIKNVNSATTSWTLPDGPGLHFAYVLVSNGAGGYVERRVVVNTDTIGTPLSVPTPKPFTIPPGQDPGMLTNNFTYRGFLHGSSTLISVPLTRVDIPDVPVVANDQGAQYPAVAPTNVRGEFIIPNIQYVSKDVNGFNVLCSPTTFLQVPSLLTNALCGVPLAGSPLQLPLPNAIGYYTDYGLPNFIPDYTTRAIAGNDVVGNLSLGDGNPCGIVDAFFGIEVTGKATLLDASGNTLSGPVRTNQWGDFDLPYEAQPNDPPASVSFQCENDPGLTFSLAGYAPTTNADQPGTMDLQNVYLRDTMDPVVTAMTATLNGTPVGQLLPPASGAPSDIVPLEDGFLSKKGLDSRLGACQYYKAIGAVQGCDAQGNFSGAINFEDWKSHVRIDNYAPAGTAIYTATYVNAVDLNITRNHHSVSYSTNTAQSPPFTYVGTYVCNSLGPQNAQGQADLFPPQNAQGQFPEVDTAVQNAVNGKNLIACVAMDFSSGEDVNGGVPFIRFYIFGPSGQLLPSINLDTRSEKFVPGSCVVCHGGSGYVGKYPENGSGFASVGGHFLPYDTGNFEYSSAAALTEAAQEQAIFNLNQNITNTGGVGAGGLTPAEANLITQWYANGPTLNKSYVDPTWHAQGQDSAYLNLYARSCRTCHVALEEYNFEQYANIKIANPIVDPINCQPKTPIDRNRAYSMPNSLITFNRLWLSGTDTSTNQFELLYQLLGCTGTSPNPSTLARRANLESDAEPGENVKANLDAVTAHPVSPNYSLRKASHLEPIPAH